MKTLKKRIPEFCKHSLLYLEHEQGEKSEVVRAFERLEPEQICKVIGWECDEAKVDLIKEALAKDCLVAALVTHELTGFLIQILWPKDHQSCPGKMNRSSQPTPGETEFIYAEKLSVIMNLVMERALYGSLEKGVGKELGSVA